MIQEGVQTLGSAVLSEEALVRHIHPLFSRVLARPEIYLANHSLGRPLDRTAQDVQRGLEAWYHKMDGAWDDWLEELNLFRSQVATLIGAPRPDCMIPKTSAGQGLRAILNSYDRPIKVVTTRGEFDSIDFILKVYAGRDRLDLTYVEPDEQGEFQVDAMLQSIDERTDLVVVSMVMFATGQVVDGLERLVAKAHRQGARVLLDLYHAAGALPVDVQALGADFAIGGSYKYLRGGPGACWLYVHPRHLDGSLATLDTGWFAKKAPFSYERPDIPAFAAGGDAFLESTPPILPYLQAKAGLEFTLSIGVDRLRAYSLQQQALLIKALELHGVEAIGARSDRGAFVVVPHSHADRLVMAIKAEGVNADARSGCLRLCPDVLTTSHELRIAAERLGAVFGRAAVQ